MRGKRLLAGGVVVLAAIAGAALLYHRQRTAAGPATPTARVSTPPPGEVVLSGKIRAAHIVSVGATGEGTISAFLAGVGQEVEEGQLLAHISSQGLETSREVATIALNNTQARVAKFEAQVAAARMEASRAQAGAARARGEFDRAEKDYKRQQFLHSEGAAPRLAYEKAAREYEASQASSSSLDRLARQADERVQSLLDELRAARKILDDRQKQLDDATTALTSAGVYSPVDGTVVARKGDVGKSATEAGRDLFEIATGTLSLQVAVEPEPPVLERIKVGQPAMVLIPDFQSEGIPGAVGAIKDTVVLVDFTSPNPAIKPGLTAEVRIRLDGSGTGRAVK